MGVLLKASLLAKNSKLDYISLKLLDEVEGVYYLQPRPMI